MLILANKQDLPGARESQEIEKLLGLNELTPAAPLSGSSISGSGCPAKPDAKDAVTQASCGSSAATAAAAAQFKGWHIQPACAITGEGLLEGLDALYEMIVKRRKINKANKKKVR